MGGKQAVTTRQWCSSRQGDTSDIWYSTNHFSGWTLVTASRLVICFNLVLSWLHSDWELGARFSFGRRVLWSSHYFSVSRPLVCIWEGCNWSALADTARSLPLASDQETLTPTP